MLLLSVSVCNITLFRSSGNTYDRSIVVDEEESSIVLYDIWEQVSYTLFIKRLLHLRYFINITLWKDASATFDAEPGFRFSLEGQQPVAAGPDHEDG